MVRRRLRIRWVAQRDRLPATEAQSHVDRIAD